MRFRNEYKHEIGYFDALQLKKRLMTVARLDGHSNDDGYYIVKSLYFDNYTDKALREKVDGVRKREKFRIRYYNDDKDFIRLEKKSKIDGKCLKESVRITEEECKKIINGDIYFLRMSENNLLRELYAKMRYQLLRPKNIVVYKRESYVFDAGDTRITIDSNISSSNSVKKFLEPDLPLIKSGNDIILEVKWTDYLPEIMRDAVRLKNRKTSSFSKYAYTRKF